MAVTFPFGQDVTLVTRTVGGRDRYGNDTFTTTSATFSNCPVWPRMSAETVQGEDLVVIGLVAIIPAGTVVAAKDAVQIGGLKYEVDGEPAVYVSPFTNLNPGVMLNLRRVTG